MTASIRFAVWSCVYKPRTWFLRGPFTTRWLLSHFPVNGWATFVRARAHTHTRTHTPWTTLGRTQRRVLERVDNERALPAGILARANTFLFRYSFLFLSRRFKQLADDPDSGIPLHARFSDAPLKLDILCFFNEKT